jgi:hypothetical protein
MSTFIQIFASVGGFSGLGAAIYFIAAYVRRDEQSRQLEIRLTLLESRCQRLDERLVEDLTGIKVSLARLETKVEAGLNAGSGPTASV